MDCNMADDLIMKYMDNVLTEKEADLLNAHLRGCKSCKSDFLVYDRIISDFAQLEIVNAPEGFVEQVMHKVSLMPPIDAKSVHSSENLLYWVWGLFSVLLGLGFLAVVNQEAIMQFLSAYPELAMYVEALAPVSVFVAELSASLSRIVSAFSAQASSWLSASRYVLLVIFAGLALTQYFIHKKDKVEAK